MFLAYAYVAYAVNMTKRQTQDGDPRAGTTSKSAGQP